MSHILVVEDSPTQAGALRVLLESAGLEIETALDGETGLAAFRKTPFDLVICDILMPGLSGYDVCRAIKQDADRGGTPVMLLTTLTEAMDIVQGLECGADYFISKPYQPDVLIGRIRHILDGKHRRSVNRVRMEAEVEFLGKKLTISSEKQQILDLLLTTFEDIVRTNRELQATKAELAAAKATVEGYARQLEDRVRWTESKYQRLMDRALDAKFLLDSAGCVQEANQRAAEMLGLSVERIIGRDFRDFLAPATPEESRERLAQVLAAGTGRVDSLPLDCRSGPAVDVDVSVSIDIVDDNATMLLIAHDVTQRKRSETRLRAAKEEWERTFDALADHVCTLDRSGAILRANRAMRDRFEPIHGNLVGLDYRVVYCGTPRPDPPPPCAAVLAGGPPVVAEGGLAALPGWYQVACYPLIGPDGERTGAVSVVRDLTDQRRLEERLRRAEKMEVFGQLAGGVAHDFNNLLTIINGYSDVMLRDLPAGDVNRPMIEEVRKAGERASALTRQLLAFSRQQVIEPRILDLNAVVTDTEKMLRRLIGEDLTLTAVLDPTLGRIKADAGQMEQILLNLAVNARDAMPRHGLLTIETANVELDESYARTHPKVTAGRHVLLAVSDTGHGMTDEVKARIFEPFFTTKEPGKGTGLGLATVFGIVEQSGGHIEVYSEVGKGTTFKIYFPRIASHSVMDVSLASTRAPVTGGSETVLLVEDEAGVRGLARFALQANGYRVLEADNPVDALALAEACTEPIHLLMSDVILPQMGGRELSEQLKVSRPDVRVLFVSGYTSDAVVRHGVLEAEVAFLQKPFTIEALLRKVRAVLDQP